MDCCGGERETGRRSHKGSSFGCPSRLGALSHSYSCWKSGGAPVVASNNNDAMVSSDVGGQRGICDGIDSNVD
eukprot:11125272-Ditylum_brightwellii.AAC.1